MTTLLTSFQFKRRVRFADTNEFGQVHFDVYIRLMEETEYAFLRSRGLRVVLDDGKGIIGFPRLHSNVQIDKPLRLDDEVETTLQLIEVSGKKITYEFAIQCRGNSIAKGCFEVACCRFPGGKDPYAILIPDFVAEKLCADN